MRFRIKSRTFSLQTPQRTALPVLIGQVPFDVLKLHQSEAMAAQHGMVDRGDGEKQVRVGPDLSDQSQLCWQEEVFSTARVAKTKKMLFTASKVFFVLCWLQCGILSVCLPVSLFACLSVHLSLCLSLCLSVCL